MTREEAISRINNDLEWHKKELSAPYKTALKMAIEALQEQKTGKWLYGATETGALNIQYREYICSECGWSHSLMIPRNYCPNCGSRNEVEGEEE